MNCLDILKRIVVTGSRDHRIEGLRIRIHTARLGSDVLVVARMGYSVDSNIGNGIQYGFKDW
jgi:hypothetical protein